MRKIAQMKRPRVKHKATFAERLAAEAKRLKEQANQTPPGPDRDILQRKVRQTETAFDINAWLTSSGSNLRE